jgi:DNA (cytosine-5)-methyltransferase 1
VLELFAGAGGMAVGLHRAGFQHVALLERDPNAVATLRANAASGAGVRPDADIEVTEIRRFRYGRAIARDVALLAAGTPCQPFSLAGNHRGTADERNLFPEVFRAQRELVPRAVLVENVWGLARPGFRPYLEYLLLRLALPYVTRRAHEGWASHKVRLTTALSRARRSTPTYDVRVAAVECANFGVPQRRNRLFIIATRTDLEGPWNWPEARYSEAGLLDAKYISGTYWREHGLRSRRGPKRGRAESMVVPVGTSRWRTVRDVLGCLPAPTRNGHERHHPNHYWIPGAREYRGHNGSCIDEPAKTLKAGVHGVPGGENMVRLAGGSLRYFSIHEAALLQTFPPAYVFCGTRSSMVRQIGNAAPVRVVQLLGRKLREALGYSPARGGGFRAPLVDLVEGAALSQL